MTATTEHHRHLQDLVQRARATLNETSATLGDYEMEHYRELFPDCFERDGAVLNYRPRLGDNVWRAAEIAVAVARSEHGPVRVTFNSRTTVALPDSTTDDVLAVIYPEDRR